MRDKLSWTHAPDGTRWNALMLIGTVPPDLTRADLDGDGQLTLADLRALIRILVGVLSQKRTR